MKAVIILCCIALSTSTKSTYSFGPGGFPYGFNPWGDVGARFGGFNNAATTVVARPTAIGFGRGHAVSTPRGTLSSSIGKGFEIAPHNASQIIKVGPIIAATGPLGSDHPTNVFVNGHGPYNLDGIYYSQGYGIGQYGGGFPPDGDYELDGGSAFGGYVPSTRDIVGAVRGNAEASAVGSRVSGQPTGVSSSGTGRAVMTPQGIIGVANSASTSVTTGFGHFPYGKYRGGFGGEFGFGGPSSGIGSHYRSTKKF